MRNLFLYLLLFMTLACTQDKLTAIDAGPEPACEEAPTYENSVKAIIDNSCAYTGCHVSGNPGDYTNYIGLNRVVTSGAFESRVFTQKDDPFIGMPPSYAPNGRPTDLTAEELDLLRCWIDSGSPEL